MQGLQYVVTDILIPIYEKSYASSKPTRWEKTAFLEVFRPYLDFWSEITNYVTTYVALGCAEAVYEVSARLTKL